MNEICPHCQRIGRVWCVAEGDLYCGLCGLVLSDVEVLADASTDRSSDAPAAMTSADSADGEALCLWLLAPGQSAARNTVRVRSTGCFNAVVDSIDVETRAKGAIVTGPHAAKIKDFKGPMELRPGAGESFTLVLDATGPTMAAAPGYRELTVIVSGRLSVQEAPSRFVARPLADDHFSRLAASDPAVVAGGGAAPAAEVSGAISQRPRLGPTAGEAPTGLCWELQGELLLLAWSNGKAQFEVSCLPEHWAVDGRLPDLSDSPIVWEPDGKANPRGEAAQPPTVVRHGDSVQPFKFTIEAAGLGPDLPQVRGRVRFTLRAIGRPEIVVPLRVAAGRPEYDISEPKDGVPLPSLPQGYPSLLPLSFTPASSASSPFKHLNNLIAGFSLGLSSDPALHWSATELGKGPGVSAKDLRFRLRVHVPPGAGQVKLNPFLVALLRNGRTTPVSPEKELPFKTYDPKERRGRGRVLVADFGTTNTCLCRGEGAHSRSECLDMGDMGIPGSSDVIETIIWLGADGRFGSAPAPAPAMAGARGLGGPRTIAAKEPACLIGQAAREKARETPPDRGALLGNFKPEIANDQEEYRVPAAVAAKTTYTAAELTELFLRELVLEARARLNQELLGEFLVTCPTTFSSVQRRTLEQGLEELKEYGITGRVGIHLDEANAGAFPDLDRYLRENEQARRRQTLHAMIADFGGGTIDIALIRAERDKTTHADANGHAVFDLRPMGVTGLRDFAGHKITRAIALLLSRRLETHLYASGKKAQLAGEDRELKKGEAPWVPLPHMDLSGYSLAAREAGRMNMDLLMDVAEQVKVVAYSADPAAPASPSALGRMIGFADLSPSAQADQAAQADDLIAPNVKRLNFQGITSPLWYVKALDAPKPEKADRNDWSGWFRALKLFRKDVDNQLRPALEEAFERARHLWDKVRGSEPYYPPEMMLLAGSTSCLPIIVDVAAEVLGIDPEPVRKNLDRHRLKRKVAVGAAMYANIRDVPAETLEIRPPTDPSDYVLLPIVYQADGDVFREVFRPGYCISESKDQPASKTFPRRERLALRLFENCDYREKLWDPAWHRNLLELGLKATGKEWLADVLLELDGGVAAGLTFWMTRGEPELGEPENSRVLVVRFPDPGGKLGTKRVLL
jgi:hypothetical protein